MAPVRNELVSKIKVMVLLSLRKNHNRSVVCFTSLQVLSFLLIVSLPAIIVDWMKNATEEVAVPVDAARVDLLAPPPLDETEPPPPPPPPPPVMETVKFTPPVVTDEEVPRGSSSRSNRGNTSIRYSHYRRYR